jgi:hypothetical protein
MPAPVPRTLPDLQHGGVVAVVLGRGGDLPSDYAYHPRVRSVEGHKIDPKLAANAIPDNTKLVIFGDGEKLPRAVFGAVHRVLKARRLPYQIKGTVSAVQDALTAALGGERVDVPRAEGFNTPAIERVEPAAESEEVNGMAPCGAVQAFLDKHGPELLGEDATMPAAEMGRRLFRLAQVEKLPTTLGSMQQAVRLWKRKHRVGERPASVIPQEQKARYAIDEVIDAMAGAVEQLRKFRDHFQTVESENVALKAQLRKAREVFDTFKEDVFA